MNLQWIFRLLVIIGLFLFPHQIHSKNMLAPSSQTVQTDGNEKPLLRVPAGWTVHRETDGLVVFHPLGWKIQRRAKGAFVAYRQGNNGGADALALVQPLESIQGRAAGVLEHIGQVFPDILPNVRVHNLRHVSKIPEVVFSTLHYQAGSTVFEGSAMCFRQQRQGVVYVMAAIQSDWRREQPVLKKILTSFFYAGRGIAHDNLQPSEGLPEMVTWQDPIEHSFTCPVPKGWKVEGGLRRFTATDIRPEVVTTSPDGSVLVRLGDAGIPTMALNSGMLASCGFQEGSWYSPDGLNKWLVMRYLPGSYFLSEFYLPNQFEHFTIVGQKDLQQISRQTVNNFLHMGMRVQVDTGQLRFDVHMDGSLRKGFGLAQTAFFPLPAMPDSGHWTVLTVFGYLAAPGQETLAEGVLMRLVSGYRVNPRWQAMQNRTIGKVSQIMSDTNREINNIISQTFANRAASEDRMAGRRSRVIRDQVLIQDPQTGENFEIPSGSNYYWRKEGTNTFFGTESPEMPKYWLKEMKVLDE